MGKGCVLVFALALLFAGTAFSCASAPSRPGRTVEQPRPGAQDVPTDRLQQVVQTAERLVLEAYRDSLQRYAEHRQALKIALKSYPDNLICNDSERGIVGVNR